MHRSSVHHAKRENATSRQKHVSKHKEVHGTESHAHTPRAESDTTGERQRKSQVQHPGRKAGREKHRAERWIRRGCPVSGHRGNRAREAAREGLTSSTGPQRPP